MLPVRNLRLRCETVPSIETHMLLGPSEGLVWGGQHCCQIGLTALAVYVTWTLSDVRRASVRIEPSQFDLKILADVLAFRTSTWTKNSGGNQFWSSAPFSTVKRCFHRRMQPKLTSVSCYNVVTRLVVRTTTVFCGLDTDYKRLFSQEPGERVFVAASAQERQTAPR